jgi:hypothetical protein
MAEKTSQQYKPGRDPLQGILNSLSPMLTSLLNSIVGSKEFQMSGHSGRFPNGFAGLFDIGQAMANFVDKEELEAMMGPISEAQKQFAQSLAFQFNKKIMGMSPEEARQFSTKKLSAGRIAAWLLMQANGTNAMLGEMEKAVDNMRRRGVSGEQAKAWNQRVMGLMASTYATMLNPDNYGKYGNLNPLELAQSLPSAIRQGYFNDVLQNNKYWGKGNQPTLQTLQNLQSRLGGLGRSISYALDTGLAQTPATAVQDLTTAFGVDPFATYGMKETTDILRNLSSLRNSMGMQGEELAALIKSAGPGGLSTVQDFLTLTNADQFTHMAGINPAEYNKALMGAIQHEEPAVQMFSGIGAILNELVPDRADEMMKEIMDDPESWSSYSVLGDNIRRITGMDIRPEDVFAAMKTDGARKWRYSGTHVPYMMKDYRSRILYQYKQQFASLGLDTRRSLGGGFVSNAPMDESGMWSRANIIANKVGTPKTLDDYRKIYKIDEALDQAAKNMGLPSWQVAEKIMGIGAQVAPQYRYNELPYNPPDVLTENVMDVARRNRLGGAVDDWHGSKGRDMGGLGGITQNLYDPEVETAFGVFKGIFPNDEKEPTALNLKGVYNNG